MTSIICKAYFLNPAETTIIAVSASFQCALTPWLVTMAAKKYDTFSTVATLQCYSLSPTFQYTTGLSVCFKSNEEQQQLMNSDLCAPLFSHLKTLIIKYEDGTTFNDGNEVADFIQKFEKLSVVYLIHHPVSTTPAEVIAFYIRMFHSKATIDALLVSLVSSYLNIAQWYDQSDQRRSEYTSLIKQHKIIPFLVQKMEEVYRNDHGESLCIFLYAIKNSFMRSGAWTESDSIDELVPMLDRIEAIVVNGDLLHHCFQNQEFTSDPEDQKWATSIVSSQILKCLLYWANYSRIEFMQRYGRTLLPQLTDFIFSKFESSKSSLGALTQNLDLFFIVIDDFFWTDEVESSTDEEGLREMLDSGRRLLQHIPFGKVEFAMEQAIKLPSAWYVIGYFNQFLAGIIHYWNAVASLSSQLSDAVSSEVASQLIKHNIIPVFFHLVVSRFDQQLQDKGMPSAVVFANILSFLHPAGATNNNSHLLAISQDFFSRDGILDKLLDFSQLVCVRFEEEFRNFRRVVHKSCNLLLAVKELSEEDASKLNQSKAIMSKLRLVLDELKTFVNYAKDLLNANGHSEGESSGGMDGLHFVRIEDFVVQHHGLKSSHDFYVQENSEKMKLIQYE